MIIIRAKRTCTNTVTETPADEIKAEKLFLNAMSELLSVLDGVFRRILVFLIHPSLHLSLAY